MTSFSHLLNGDNNFSFLTISKNWEFSMHEEMQIINTICSPTFWLRRNYQNNGQFVIRGEVASSKEEEMKNTLINLFSSSYSSPSVSILGAIQLRLGKYKKNGIPQQNSPRVLDGNKTLKSAPWILSVLSYSQQVEFRQNYVFSKHLNFPCMPQAVLFKVIH